MESTNARIAAYARFSPETTVAGRIIVVNDIVARAAPADMLLMFREMASRNETLFTRPVESRTNVFVLSSGIWRPSFNGLYKLFARKRGKIYILM